MYVANHTHVNVQNVTVPLHHTTVIHVHHPLRCGRVATRHHTVLQQNITIVGVSGPPLEKKCTKQKRYITFIIRIDNTN